MLVINALQVKKNYSGVGVYTASIINALVKKFSKGRIYARLDVFGELPPNWELIIKKIYDRDLVRWLWINLVFPFNLKKNDVLFSTFTEAPLLFNGKQIITVHDLMPISLPAKHSVKLKFYYRKILPMLLQKSYAIIAVSETTKQEITDIFPKVSKKKIFVVYNGYDDSMFNTIYDENGLNNFRAKYKLDKYILYVGRISKIKNVMLIIEAFSRIHESIPQDLLIVGRDESGIMPFALEFIRQQKIEGRVKFIEYLDKSEIAPAYKGSEVYVNASLAEGFGLPAVEAMACGVPCILSDINAFREISGGAACLFDPSDSKELAEKIMLLLSNNDLYESQKFKGLRRAEQFSWRNSAEQTAGIIASALSSESDS